MKRGDGIMHLEETYTGFMRVASNRAGKPYKDWREHYVDQAGIILIFQSDSRPGKYAVYFFYQGECICIRHWENCKWMTGK